MQYMVQNTHIMLASVAGAVIPCVWEAGISGWFEAMGANTLRMVKTLRPHHLCVVPWPIKPDLRPKVTLQVGTYREARQGR